MTDKPAILVLIAKYLDNTEDFELKSQVDQYRRQSAENEVFYQEIEKLWLLSGKSTVLFAIDEGKSVAKFKNRLATIPRQVSQKPSKSAFARMRWVAAAVILIALAISTYYLGSSGKSYQPRVYASDATPGGNKAVLVLADGRKISLTDIENGDVAKEAGLSITKTADGQLVYNVLNQGTSDNNNDNVFNTIETPRGGMWEVRLPDGSVVWLNAASSLTYPIAFSKGKKRVVELKGEAYFEVTKDKLHPFIVKTTNQEVEVLGTSFNINSYTDEVAVKTTLLEGSVRITPNGLPANVLAPDEQAVLMKNEIAINKVDASEAIDWKNGYFMFNNERQESIMRKIARWYNVKIAYADAEAKDVTYYGSISRFENVSKVLQKFERTGEVRFEIEKNKITVYKEETNN